MRPAHVVHITPPTSDPRAATDRIVSSQRPTPRLSDGHFSVQISVQQVSDTTVGTLY
eukprot:m.197919 g.197919  ORF g.197919 m.197919 type:complete len:57 (-) comp20269_c0_seq1:110-280(-)